MIRLGNRDPESLSNLILGEMLMGYRLKDPKTLYRPVTNGHIDSRKVNALLGLSQGGFVRIYHLDGVMLGAEITHEGFKRAERLTNAR